MKNIAGNAFVAVIALIIAGLFLYTIKLALDWSDNTEYYHIRQTGMWRR